MRNKIKPCFNTFNRMMSYFIWMCGFGGTMCGIFGIITHNSIIISWLVLFCGIINMSVGLFDITCNKIMRELEYIKFDIKCLEERVEDVENS